MAPDGTLRVSMPLYAPVLIVKQFIRASRVELRTLVDTHRQTATVFSDGMQIGKSHTLIVRSTSRTTSVERHKQQIIVNLNESETLSDEPVIQKVRAIVIRALRLEAKSYLPKRLAYLAEKTGFSYISFRFSHASGRWGSCSTSGTISLNIALMKLPFELIDYVLLHELAHTKQMNHSSDFWELVEQFDPQFKLHRKKLKLESPSI